MKYLAFFLVLVLTACAPFNAIVQHAIAETQTAQAANGKVEIPPPVSPATPLPGEATNPAMQETAIPVPAQGEATTPAVNENGNPILVQTEIPATEVPATGAPAAGVPPATGIAGESPVPGGTQTVMAFNPAILPPKTSAPARKDTASGLIVVAVLFLVGILVQFGSKEGEKHP